MKKALLFAAAFVLLSRPGAEAGPLTEARVTKIINDVRLVDPATGARAAAVNDLIKEDLGLRTGLKSRSELLFQDETLTRIGPETFFSFRPGTRDLTLQQGTMLLQVPKGLGGAKIHTAAVTASITGTTIMIEYLPKQHIKVLVLEGSLRLSVNGRVGDSLLLLPGKMVIMAPDAKRIPEPVSVNLALLVKTSSLVNFAQEGETAQPLPSLPLIEREIAEQGKQKGRTELLETNLVIAGHGTKVTMVGDTTVEQIAPANEILLAKAEPTPTPAPLPSATPRPISTPTPHSLPLRKAHQHQPRPR